MKKKKNNKQLYIVRKYIWAKSAPEAIKLERKVPVQDCWIDDEWKKSSNAPKDAIGFYVPSNNEYE